MKVRLAREDEQHRIAELRWCLKAEEGEPAEGRDAFVAAFLTNNLHNDDLDDFVAEDGIEVIGAMSVRKVWKVPSPGRAEAAWGYLTNCYVLPEHRSGGIGAAMLAYIESWARGEGLELLVVWPSDQAYSFYERAGYARRKDPLVLDLEH